MSMSMFVIITPSTSDVNEVELGLNQVMLGLGRPEAVHSKVAELGAVTVRGSGESVMLAATKDKRSILITDGGIERYS